MVFEDKLNTIIQGDCLEVMKEIPDNSVDLVLTDPPYGQKRDKGFGGSRGFSGSGKLIEVRTYPDEWDDNIPDKQYFQEMLRISKNAIIFGGNNFTDRLPIGKHWIVWDKLNTMPTFGDCELIWTNIKRNSVKKITHEYNGLIGKEPERYHPTQKPVLLIKKLLLKNSFQESTILDPFLGSGTTAVACIETDRNFIGIEINPEYCEIAEKRIKLAYEKKRQGELFK